MKDDSKVPIKIVQSDLTGDCVRVNRRFDLAEGRVSAVEGDVSTIQGQITSIDAALKAIPGASATPIAQPNPPPLSAPATASVTLSTSFQPVTGMSIKLTRTGWWVIEATARLNFAGDVGDGLYVSVFADSSALPGIVITIVPGSPVTYDVVSKAWAFHSLTGAEQITVQARKTGGAGSSNVEGNATASTQTSQVLAFWVSP